MDSTKFVQYPIKSSEDIAQLLHEHEMLEIQIIHNDTVSLQIFAGTLLTVGAVVSIAVASVDTVILARAGLLLMAAAISVIAESHAVARARSTRRITSYLRNFTEPQLKYVKWESRLMKFRDHQRAPRDYFSTTGSFTSYQVQVYSVMSFACFCGAIYYFWLWYSPNLLSDFQSKIEVLTPAWAVLATTAIGFLALCIFVIIPIWNQYRYVKERAFDVIWREVAKEELRGKADASSTPNMDGVRIDADEKGDLQSGNWLGG